MYDCRIRAYCESLPEMPRSLITTVTWCNASGREVQKSQLFLALRRLVRGSRWTTWLRSGNLSGSRKKKTGVLLPHHIPVTLLGVEFKCKTSDITFGICSTAFSGHGGKACEHFSFFLPISEKILARVYLVMSWVTVKVP